MPLPPKPEIRTQQSLLAELVANIQTQQQDAAISTPALQLLRQLVEKAEELPPPINSSSRIAIPKKAGRPRKNKSISLEAPEAGGFVPIVLPEVDLSLRHRKTASNPLIEANIAQPAKPTYATSPVIAQFRHDDLQRPIASTSAHSSTQESVDVPKKLRYWAAGCCNCGKTESHGWRTRKKRKRPLHLQSKSSNGSEVDASIDAWQNMDEAKAKLCEGMLNVTLHLLKPLEANWTHRMCVQPTKRAIIKGIAGKELGKSNRKRERDCRHLAAIAK